MNKSLSTPGGRNWAGLLILLAILVVTLGALFIRSFTADQVLFSNDGPLGIISSASARTTLSTVVSAWQDLNWLGNEGITPDASLSTLLAMVLQPLGYAKFAAPIGLLVLGFCAWVFFRQLRLAPIACVVGAVATTLNSDFFSTSCWGIVPQPICIGANFLALAAIARAAEGSALRSWVRVILAGLAVGMGVVQGADIGALFSLFVAAYIVYHTLFLENKSGGAGKKIGGGFIRVAVVSVFALIIATHTLTSLIGTQIKGVAGLEEDEQARAQRWQFATEWSLPPVEILQVAVPGLFGYRQNWHMYDDQQPTDDQYWGLIGSNDSGSFWRLSGTGEYAGVFVLAVALWAMLQSFRGRGSPFSLFQRRAIWFWTATLIVTALLAFGRFAPFYKFFYALPHAPAIRNPTKFMHIFSWALVILFAYGVHGLVTSYMQNAAGSNAGPQKGSLAKAAPFDRKWIAGCGAALAVAVVAWLIYGSSVDRLTAYVQTVGIPQDQAHGVALFSFHSVMWFVLFLVMAVALMFFILTGYFSGRKALLGAGLMTALVTVDLSRADAPWIVYWNTDKKYATDPVTKFLATKPYEHRVSFFQFVPQSMQTQQFVLMESAYFSQWKQHIYPYNNIQCAETIQESRIAVDKERFMAAIPLNTPAHFLRTWELLNTQYILAPDGQTLVDGLNQSWDPAKKRFRTASFPDGSPVKFNFVPKRPNLTQAESIEPVNFDVVPDPNGQLQVMEFTGALPRVSLYSNWRVNPEDDSTLQTLGSTDFDPHSLVIVSNSIGAPAAADLGQPAGTAEIQDNYQPKRVEISADVKVPSVLLLCDRYNPKWNVTVDDQPAELLRCNFIERGVFLAKPGKHKVVFQFTGSAATFAVSSAAVVFALVLSGWLAFTEKDISPAAETPTGPANPSTNPQNPAPTPAPAPKNGPEAQKNKSKKR